MPSTGDPREEKPGDNVSTCNAEQIKNYQTLMGTIQWAASTLRVDVKLVGNILAKAST